MCIRINILVEGQTEESFINRLLKDEFAQKEISLNPILVRTGPYGKGGIVKYAKVQPQLKRLCLEDPSAYVSTMFDRYALPDDFPGISSLPPGPDPYKEAEYLEDCLKKDIGAQNFIPYLSLYEFEALLYSDPSVFSRRFNVATEKAVRKFRGEFRTPEHINKRNSPARQLLNFCKGYQKPTDGALLASYTRLSTIRDECKHFDAWLSRLSSLAKASPT